MLATEMSEILAMSKAPVQIHSDASTTEHSDMESVVSCSAPHTPRVADVEETCAVVVKSSFIDLDDYCLMRQYRKLRRCVTDSALAGVLDVPVVYEPGKFSDEAQKRQPAEPSKPSQPKAAPRDECKQTSAEERTTLMLRNLPNNYTRAMFLELLDEQGLAGCYDFVYLPCDFCRDANLGYAFVNFDAAAVARAWTVFDGFSGWSLPSSKVCQVGWSGPHQGFTAHVERYRNSPVMHKSVPDAYKPVIFKDGKRKAFPRPTKKVKAPTGTFR